MNKIGLNDTLLYRLTKSPVLQGLARFFRVHKFLDGILKNIPIRRKLSSGQIYYISSYSAMLMAKELFQNSVYRPALSNNFQCSTFIDLGCHVGYFPILLREIFFCEGVFPKLRGFCVDANPLMVAETSRNLKANNIEDISVYHGLVGGGNQGTQAFYINSTSFLSSAFPQRHPEQKLADSLQVIDVPILDVGNIWRNTFGETAIDVLKIDIEGSEANFISKNTALFQLVNRVIVECHKWVVPENELIRALELLDFHCIMRINDEQHSVVLVCERSGQNPS